MNTGIDWHIGVPDRCLVKIRSEILFSFFIEEKTDLTKDVRYFKSNLRESNSAFVGYTARLLF